MLSLRAVAAVLASALMALGLSVGAAMAEGPREPHYTPKGVCLLEDGTKKEQTRLDPSGVRQPTVGIQRSVGAPSASDSLR